MTNLYSKKYLLNLWMTSHQRLGRALQGEFLNHGLVEQITRYDYRFAEIAIVHQKKKLLPDILETVRQLQVEREEFLRQERKVARRSYTCLVCESEVIGLDCLCRTAA